MQQPVEGAVPGGGSPGPLEARLADERVDVVAFEKDKIKGAVRTDFILSAEIMVIALNEVDHEPFLSRAIFLAVVAVGITVLVYGVVGIIAQIVSVRVLDLVTGVDMDELMYSEVFLPQARVIAASHVALGLIVAMAVL